PNSRRTNEISSQKPRQKQPTLLENALLSFQGNVIDCSDDDQEASEDHVSNALLIASAAGLVILGWVLFLYRRGRLKEDHALLWIAVSATIVVLSTWT